MKKILKCKNGINKLTIKYGIEFYKDKYSNMKSETIGDVHYRYNKKQKLKIVIRKRMIDDIFINPQLNYQLIFKN